MRTTTLERNTAETKIKLTLNIDGKGVSKIDTKCGFLDHMLTLFAKHGRFDLDLICDGDVYVDYHHTVEDVGICLGKAFADCIGDKKGIERYGDITLPMDETLMICAIDISGRDFLGYDVDIPAQKVGDFDTELAEEFMLGFVRNAGITLHFKQLAGRNSHHIIEGMFKAFGRAMKKAVAINKDYQDEIPSTKGVL
ncbi:MAG: imidazoleglycerol-phosphate dehydratase HisB [Firmicutes bacterium]|nr:imidazoleglycerol-phosphate dehydratase HisB [Bacillota bacterium]